MAKVKTSDATRFAFMIGANMKYLRLNRKTFMPQKVLAHHVGVTFQQVQKYECGMNSMSLRNLWKFCILTDTDINWFFEDIKKKNKKLEEPIPFVVDSIERGN